MEYFYDPYGSIVLRESVMLILQYILHNIFKKNFA